MTKRERILIDALWNISRYALPSYGSPDRPMVPLDYAKWPITAAQEALTEAKIDDWPPS